MLWQWEQVRRHVKGATTITTASMNLLPHIPTNFYEHSKHTGKMNATTISPHDEEPGADLSCRGFLHGLISHNSHFFRGYVFLLFSYTHTHTTVFITWHGKDGYHIDHFGAGGNGAMSHSRRMLHALVKVTSHVFRSMVSLARRTAARKAKSHARDWQHSKSRFLKDQTDCYD